MDQGSLCERRTLFFCIDVLALLEQQLLPCIVLGVMHVAFHTFVELVTGIAA